ncbi:unnamed protein product [Colias eurytheme]|nr:unnamed protein product [Colias eurytheme]
MSEKSEITKEISELTKKRSSYKGRITIFTGYLKSLENASPSSKEIGELELRISKLDSLYAQFDETQTRLECISDNLDLQLAERDEFENRYYKVLGQGQDMLNNYKKSQIPLPSECGSHSGKRNPVKLPTIQIPTFCGSYTRWIEFRDVFSSLIDSNDDLDDINKFHYLRTSLEGSAAVVISSIEFSSSNYHVAWKLLCDRFDNKRLLIQNHVAALFNIEPVTRESAANLKHILDEFNKNIRALESLGEPTKHWDTLLIYMITRKLDSKTFREWEEHKGNLDSEQRIELQHFLEFMRNRTTLLDTIEFSRNSHQNNTSKTSKIKAMVTTQNNKNSKDSCPKCGGGHRLSTCPQFLALSNEARLQLLPTLKVCFNCFSKSHFSNNCKKQGCRICKRKHSVLIHVADKQKPVVHGERHDDNISATPSTVDQNNLTLSASVSSASLDRKSRRGDVILSTALVKLYDSNNREHIGRACLDSGSTSSLLSEKMFRQLNLPYNRIDQSVLGINNATTHINKMCQLSLKSLNEKFVRKINCFVLPSLTDNVPSRTVDISNLNIPTNVCLADPHFYTPASVDIILGADIFWDIVGSQRIKLGVDKPILCDTRLGWIVSGPMNNSSYQPNPIQCNYVNGNPTSDIFNQNVQNQLTRFWNLEEVNNIKSSSYSPEQKLCEEHFVKNTTRLKDGRFCVRIPLKEDPSVLGDSLQRAKQCFLSLERRLLKQPKLYEMYREFISEYQSLGHMSECELKSDNNAHFIPHHGVLRESSTTTKLRAVFNASSPTTSTQVSLNSIQMVGPTVQDDLLSILLRFRQHKYVILADVEKMYRQILVHPDDRYLQRIIWRDNPSQQLKAFELNTVTYGTASAPFLATRCLNQLGLECDDTQIAEIILHDFYVDDLLSGGDDLNVVRDIRNKVTATLASAQFPLRKWKSNESQLVSEFSGSTHDLNIGGSEPSKTLGLGWQPEPDKLYFPIEKHDSSNSESTSMPTANSKREILSVISQIFDPLGLVSPVVIKFKIFLQTLWLQNLSWDDPLPPEIQRSWLELIENINVLSNVRVPRRAMLDNVRLEFHVFSDASEKAYGACLYVRSVDSCGNVFVRLLLAKSRVAPIKATTIPRLELCGAQVAAKLYEKAISSLRVKVGCTIFWTDSTIVLGWLKMLPSKLHTFVRNRVGDILEKTGDCVWRHVPTEQNPADYVSRGINADTIQSLDLWWSGPEYLKESSSNWPPMIVSSDSLPETRIEVSCLVKTDSPPDFIQFDRFSNFNRLRRAIAYVLRFVEACKGRRATTSFLTETELNYSLNIIIQTSQKESFPEYDTLLQKKPLPAKSCLLKFNVFLDENNLMRVGGRIRNSEFSYDKKHPLLLQSTHRFTQLLFKYEHTKLCHAGPQLLLASIREVYWPIGGRNLARASYRNCIKCTRMKGNVVAPIMGDLPQRRLAPGGFPFETVGVDYAGPIASASRQGRGCRIVKVYIAIFICFTTKAIHLELVGDLTSNCFILALRKFVARRGKPLHIYSDNGKSFVGAYNDLAKFLQQNSDSLSSDLINEGVHFHFIPAYSPNFGGLWEAGVKSTKFHLLRVLGNCHLTYEELYTTLTQIEAILNSRPLTPLSSHPEDLTPLTPGHFLIGRPMTAIPTEDYQGLKPETHLTRYQRIEQLRQHFWARWSKEYISELQTRTKWQTSSKPLEVNSLVLIKEDNMPPLKWKLGRVVALFPGLDGIARVAEIRTANGIVKRSFSKICPLPITDKCVI